MDFLLSLPRRVTNLFYGPSPGTLTRQQIVNLVWVTATVYILLPNYCRIKELLFVPILGGLAGVLFDFRESLLAARDSIPWPLNRFLTSSTNGTGDHPSTSWDLDLGGIWATMTTRLQELAAHARITVVQLQRRATARLGEFASRVRMIAEQLRRIAREAAVKILQGALRFLDPSKDPSEGGSEPPPEYTPSEWHGILVRTPPLHDNGSTPPLYPREEPILWEDYYDTTDIPSMVPSLVAETHLSFCLVQTSVWESRRSSILYKLMTGLYWDIKGEEGGCDGERWYEEQVRGIIGLKDLGPVDIEPGLSALHSCHRYYTHLRRDWEYKELFWNDVDFAIILGRLVTGKGAAFALGLIFALFETLKFERFLRRGKSRKADSTDSSFIGGFLDYCLTRAAEAIGKHAWDQRKLAYRDLLTQYPQLDTILDLDRVLS